MDKKRSWWAAVLQRDRKFDRVFVYAVRSTGIYCRPTCPSRRPNRAQVAFFALAGAAEEAGFRPCRRCKPQEPIADEVHLINAACRHIEQNFEQPLKLADLSAMLHVSASHFRRVFKRTVGVSPYQYATACRLKSVKGILRRGSDVTSALYQAGFGSGSRLYERTAAEFGMTPATYGRGGRGVRIGYTTVLSPLGRLLVAATSRGVCAISLGSSADQLKAALAAEYPEAELFEEKTGLKDFVRRLLGHLSGTEPVCDLPLDVRATAFQRQVWEALRGIPYGETRSYSQLATGIGKPKAARAVANACAANPVALVIPCHRVIAHNGAPGGYRWGKNRKRILLEEEKKEST